jgi:hypothetical protein
VNCQRERPNDWYVLPEQSQAVELAEETLFTPVEACIYVRAFNELIIDLAKSTWAVAVLAQCETESRIAPGTTLRREQLVDLRLIRESVSDVLPRSRSD